MGSYYRCRRCRNPLPSDQAAKCHILRDIFGEFDGLLCDDCYNRPVEKLKRLWHRLTCKICWEYHNWYDFKRWLVG